MTKKKIVVKKVAKKTIKKPTKKNKKTYVAIVLDKSSSMGSIRNETISSFNEQVSSIRNSAKESDTFVTLSLFSDEVTISKFAEPLNELKEITTGDYIPSGMTAMYDAIGMTVERMKKEIDDINDPNTAILFVVITDGQENASKTWSGLDISALVKALTATKRWTFSILGANIDLAALSEKIGIAKSNMAKFSADSKGVLRGTQLAAQSYNRYFATRDATDDLAESALIGNFYSESSNEITDTTKESDK